MLSYVVEQLALIVVAITTTKHTCYRQDSDETGSAEQEEHGGQQVQG